MKSKLTQVSLPFGISYALALYYLNRQKPYEVRHHFVPGRPTQHYVLETDYKWDKQADLERIAKATAKAGWSFAATAGTFWFRRPGVKHFHYHVSEDSFPLATKLPVNQLTPE